MNRIFITLLSISIFTSCIKDEKVKTTYTYSNSSTKIVAISTVNNTDSLSANYIITPNDSFNKTYYDLGSKTPPFDYADSLIITINDSLTYHFNQFNLTDEMNLLNSDNYEGGSVGSKHYHYTYTFTERN